MERNSPTPISTMKKSLFLMIAVLIAAAFTSCSSSSIEGQWKVTCIDVSLNGEQITLSEEMLPPDAILEFLSDGTYNEAGPRGGTGEWSLDGKTLTRDDEEYEVVELTSKSLILKIIVDVPEADIHGEQTTTYVRYTGDTTPAPGSEPAPAPAPAPGSPGEPAPVPAPAQ